jgi:hypothetical protein
MATSYPQNNSDNASLLLQYLDTNQFEATLNRPQRPATEWPGALWVECKKYLESLVSA